MNPLFLLVSGGVGGRDDPLWRSVVHSAKIDGQAGGTMMILAQILHILVVPNLTSGSGANQVGFCDAHP